MKVSICTPTYNRRPFIPTLIQCVRHQTYTGPLEWVIVDDGTDPIGDLVASLPQVKYIRLHKKAHLGYKRNLLHANCTGDILVYMDDDDYYPPTRISHAVERLMSSSALIAGSSIIHVYYPHLGEVIEFGPYGKNHATAGTFAFKKELLDLTSYHEESCMGEEKYFLKNYTIPMIQLDPQQVILVVCHPFNTVDKKQVLQHQGKSYKYNIQHWITDKDMHLFFTKTIHETEYTEGGREHKPDVEQYQHCLAQGNAFCVKFKDRTFTGNEILDILNQQLVLLRQR
jgi:glycosyltransferase involved in cell wall biosynthesis